MGAIFTRIFNFISKFKKLAIIISSIYLFAFIFDYFVGLWLKVLIYHIMFLLQWYFALVGITGLILSYLLLIYFLPDLLRILKRIINLFFK